MNSVLIVLASLIAWGGAWWCIARYFRGKGHNAMMRHLCGLAVGFLGATVVLVSLILISVPTTGDVASAKSAGPGAPNTVKAVTAPPVTVASEPDKVPPLAGGAPSASETKSPSARTLKLSTDQILKSLKRLEQSSSPLADGTPRRTVKIGAFAHIEFIGNVKDVSRYTVLFGLPSDDRMAVLETSTLVMKALSNTFPAWTKQGSNAATWLGDATMQLSENVKANRDSPSPVIVERDGKRIRYSAVPALGMFFLTVEPV